MRVAIWAELIVLLGTAIACSAPSPQTPTQAAIPQPATATIVRVATGTPGTSNPGLTQTPRLTPTPGAKEPLLAAFNNSLAKIKTYRARVPGEGRLIEVVLPDRFHQLESDDLILIGSTLYWVGSGYKPLAVPALPFMDRVNLVWLRDQVGKAEGVASLGPSTFDGVQTIGYSIDLPSIRIIAPRTPGASPQTAPFLQSIKVWFAVTDGFPRRAEYGPPVSLIVTFFDFNANIQVDPP